MIIEIIIGLAVLTFVNTAVCIRLLFQPPFPDEPEPPEPEPEPIPVDFSTVAPAPRKKIQIRLDPSKLTELRKHVAERAKAYGDLRQPSSPSPDLLQNLEIWDREEIHPE